MEYICAYVNDAINSPKLPTTFKLANVSPVLMELGHRKPNIDQLTSCPLSQKYLRRSSVNNCLINLKIYFNVFSEASENVSVLKIIKYRCLKNGKVQLSI